MTSLIVRDNSHLEMYGIGWRISEAGLALEFKEDMTVAEFVKTIDEAHSILTMTNEQLAWYKADLALQIMNINVNEREELWAAVARQSAIFPSQKTMMNISVVASAFPEEYRDARLPFGVYQELARIKDERERMEWLATFLMQVKQGHVITVAEARQQLGRPTSAGSFAPVVSDTMFYLCDILREAGLWNDEVRTKVAHAMGKEYEQYESNFSTDGDA